MIVSAEKHANVAPIQSAAPTIPAIPNHIAKLPDPKPISNTAQVKPIAARISAPVLSQQPELPAGCEVTSLTMMLQFYGIKIDKLTAAKQMKFDPTPMRRDKAGNIIFWGNPNNGFVGDVKGKSRGFGIYHTALFELLIEYIPNGIDLTTKPFDELEQQIANGIPVLAWTTVNFNTNPKWVEWDSPLGPIRTTFSVHAVLMVGYDEKYIYVNDPWTGKKDVAVDKQRFIETWEMMGKQALSYTHK